MATLVDAWTEGKIQLVVATSSQNVAPGARPANASEIAYRGGYLMVKGEPMQIKLGHDLYVYHGWTGKRVKDRNGKYPNGGGHWEGMERLPVQERQPKPEPKGAASVEAGTVQLVLSPKSNNEVQSSIYLDPKTKQPVLKLRGGGPKN